MTGPSGIIAAGSHGLISTQSRALADETERYVLRGGGTLVLALAAGEALELRQKDGGQSVELIAFSTNGQDALGALGLAAAVEPDGIHQALSRQSEDAQRVHAGLARRGLVMGGARAAQIFGEDAPAESREQFTAAQAVTIVLGAPAREMLVWEQTPPSDIAVFVRRNQLRQPGLFRLPEPLAEPRLDLTIDIASAISFEVHEGEYIQILDVAGRQCSDFLGFRRRALDRGLLRGLDATTTRTMTGQAYPKPGLYSKFFDEDRTAMVEVVQDTVGRHDTFNLACTPRYYEDMGYFGHANCSENLNEALSPYGIASQRGWPAINFFFNTNVDAHNAIWFDEPWSRPGDYVLLRALDELVCGASACPCDIDAANGWMLTPIQVRVYAADAFFKRSIGYRMTPESPPQMTRETGFHPRTSALTRGFTEYRNFWLPASYAAHGAMAEYWACREKAAIMDLSALRKMEIIGPDAEVFLQTMMPRDIRKLAPGQVVYTPICYEHGGMVDDGTLFRLGRDNFRWIGGDDASLLWLRENAAKSGLQVYLRAATEQIHNVALQGPASRDILLEIIWTAPGQTSIAELGWFRFTIGRVGGYDGIPVMISRTGYTGELGYEIFCHPDHAPGVWDAITAAGAPHGLTPLGLDALDMLRIECGLIFGGYEFDSTTDPFEAGIGFSVPVRKEDDYVGKDALVNRRAHPVRTLVGLVVEGNEAPAHGDPVFIGRAEVGRITSATRSPCLKQTIALARVDIRAAVLETALEIGRLDGQQKRLVAKVCRFPFYDPEKTRVRG
jgi:aminomethyltransferase